MSFLFLLILLGIFYGAPYYFGDKKLLEASLPLLQHPLVPPLAAAFTVAVRVAVLWLLPAFAIQRAAYFILDACARRLRS